MAVRYIHRMRKNLDLTLTVFVISVLIVVMFWPLEAPPLAPQGSDKLLHLIAFAALSYPLARTRRFGLIPVLIGASAFGGTIELVQPNFNRSTDVNDWISDTLGALIGIGFGLVYRYFRHHLH